MVLLLLITELGDGVEDLRVYIRVLHQRPKLVIVMVHYNGLYGHGARHRSLFADQCCAWEYFYLLKDCLFYQKSKQYQIFSKTKY